MDFSNTILNLRKERGLSQAALADMLFVSADLISKWENGLRRPDYETIEKLADAFDVTPDDIVGRDELLFDELSDFIPDGVKLSQDELTGILNSFLKTLKKSEAEIFVKRYYLLKNTSQIASEYGIKENHLRSIISKTRKKLRKYIAEVQK